MEKPTMPIPAPGESATIAERIVYALDVRQMSQTGLEQAAHLSRGYVSRMRRGERMKFSPDLLRRTADGLRVNYEWLATGRGEMDAIHTPAAPPPAPDRKGDARPAPALETAIAYHRAKWTPATMAAARALSTEDNAKELLPDEWTGVLDQIEAALSKIKISPKPRG
jgi:transcriptional regulator with XRE-family HTH domain